MTHPLLAALAGGVYDATLARLYGGDALPAQRARYADAVGRFLGLYGDRDTLYLFSAPGRTELGGNHTDHNRGKVLAAAVNLDVIAVAAPTDTPLVRVHSEGFPPDAVPLDSLAAEPAAYGTSAALIRGVAAGFAARGWRVGGFDAYTTSDVLQGSGLSSSAAFEVLLGTVYNHLYNGGGVSPVDVAQIAQYAENVHFGKPCGLMDQTASAVGGAVAIDFEREQPRVEQLPLELGGAGYALCIVDTQGSHADLTSDYAAIPAEMKSVAAALGADVLRQTTREALLAALPRLRAACGDRAVLRALHFFDENDRVDGQADALRQGDIPAFLRLVRASGASSYDYLQNISAPADPARQGVALALYAAEQLLRGTGGVCRVHGGGFAGTTQNFVPLAHTDAFCRGMETVWHAGRCHLLRIRQAGGVMLTTV